MFNVRERERLSISIHSSSFPFIHSLTIHPLTITFLCSPITNMNPLHHSTPSVPQIARIHRQQSTNVMLISLCFIDTPSFAISRTPGFGYPLREGIEVSLKCDVDSNPSSTPIWQKDDGDPPVRNLNCSPEAFLGFIAASPSNRIPLWGSISGTASGRWIFKLYVN